MVTDNDRPLTLCPEAVQSRHNPDGPPLCNLNNRKPCAGDPDLECDWFIGYLHDTLYGDKRIGGKQ